MKLYFLGTGASYPTVHRGVSSLGLQLEDGSVYMFDCGEGTQIQLQKVPFTGSKINKIFVTHLHGDHMFGLPGLLCTISSQIAEDTGKPNATKPMVDICGPLGLRKFLHAALSLSRSLMRMRFRIHELEPSECQFPSDWNEWPVNHDSSSCLHPSEEQGRIIKPEKDSNGQLTWHIFNDKVHSVEAGLIRHRIPSFGFIIKEKERPGTLLVPKLKQLGILPGPLFGRLKSGLSVLLEDGREVLPSEVLGPPFRGRTVVICGDTSDASPLSHLARDCDLLVHEATHDDSLAAKAKEFGHSTPSEAAEFARSIRAKTLLLNHFSQRYCDASRVKEDKENEYSVGLLLTQARAKLEGTGIAVHCSHDLFVYSLDRPKREDGT